MKLNMKSSSAAAAWLLVVTSLMADQSHYSALQEHRDRQEAELSMRSALDQSRLVHRQREANAEKAAVQNLTYYFEAQHRQQGAALIDRHHSQLEQDRAGLEYDLAILESEFRNMEADSRRQGEAYGKQMQLNRAERRGQVQQMFGAKRNQSTTPQMKTAMKKSVPAVRPNSHTSPGQVSSQAEGSQQSPTSPLSPQSNLASSAASHLQRPKQGQDLVPAAGVAGGAVDICSQLKSKIKDLIDRDKRTIGDNGPHGLKNRFPEQIYGQKGPGTDVFDNHQMKLSEQQKAILRLLRKLPDDCDPPEGAWSWATRPLPDPQKHHGPSTLSQMEPTGEQLTSKWPSPGVRGGRAPSPTCELLGAATAVVSGVYACTSAGAAAGLACAPAGGVSAIPCGVAGCTAAAGMSAAITGLATRQFCTAVESLLAD